MLNRTFCFKVGAACANILPSRLHTLVALYLAAIRASGRVRKEVYPGVTLDLSLSDWLQRRYYLGLAEQSMLRILKAFVPAGGTFVDAGAYIGLFTCVMAARC